jgi:methylenetetrahydrofolate reductase (NADPH)
MSHQTQRSTARVADDAIVKAIIALASDASIEINVQDVMHLRASAAFLSPGKKMYVSHLPKQTWVETVTACQAVHDAGFNPVPHIPVRLLANAATLDSLLADFVRDAHVNEVLLIAGDYAQVLGPYAAVKDVLSTDALSRHGITRVSLAGHPEGHPKVALPDIRNAEREKCLVAERAGLEVTLLTQFFFEPEPFLNWVRELRDSGVQAKIVAGISGPAKLATLFRYALRCGVGPSIRALGARPTSLLNLVGDRGPEKVLRGIAEDRAACAADFTGIHLFCFGGYLRTCEWLRAVAEGRFVLSGDGSFDTF